MDKIAKNKFVPIARDANNPTQEENLKNLIQQHNGDYSEAPHNRRTGYSLKELEEIYKNFPSGYHSVDKEGTVIHINETELQWLGYTAEEVIGKMKLVDLLSPASRKKFNKNFAQFKKMGSFSVAEYEYQRKDGTKFPVILSGNAFYDEKGDFTMSRTIVFNISDRKLLELQLIKNHNELIRAQVELQKKNEALNEANEKLFMVNREKDRFIGMASHDLRTPLVSIMMLSEVLMQDYSEVRPDGFGIAKTIHDAATQMQEMIHDYLNVNMIESGNIRLQLKEVDITQLTKVLISRHEEIARRKNITIFYLVKKEYKITTDVDAYTQIVENLISNAIKYTNPGKSIFVKMYKRADRVCLAVEDEGVGMKKQEMHLLFKRFQKLSSRPTAGEVSTGLGLSIVKYLTEQLGATIKVQSTPDVGSQFIVCFAKD